VVIFTAEITFLNDYRERGTPADNVECLKNERNHCFTCSLFRERTQFTFPLKLTITTKSQQ
jgi:hypothetical protein